MRLRGKYKIKGEPIKKRNRARELDRDRDREREREREREMVLWEMTLATAYFLGLKRTYRLALRIQKCVIGPKHPKIRQFVHRRIRSVFDVAVRVHKSIQERDIEVGRNLGNRILRWLDRMKPSAEIRGPPENPASRINNSNITNHQQAQRASVKINDRDSKGKLSFSPLSMRPRSFRTMGMMMQPMRPTGMGSQYWNYSHYAPAAPAALHYRMDRLEGGVFRRDIALWMLQN